MSRKRTFQTKLPKQHRVQRKRGTEKHVGKPQSAYPKARGEAEQGSGPTKDRETVVVSPAVHTQPTLLGTLPIRARNGLFVEVEVRDVKARMLVETGATDTILSSTLYYRIPSEKRPHLKTNTPRVKNADGSLLETLGSGW